VFFPLTPAYLEFANTGPFLFSAVMAEHDAGDEESAEFGLLGSGEYSASWEASLDSAEDPRARLKRVVATLLSSTTFWLFATFLILLDLAMFAWQIIYLPDRRLEGLEALISGIFVVELCLRAFAFDPRSLLSCVHLFDAAVVISSFALALLSVNNPFLAGRSARYSQCPPCWNSSAPLDPCARVHVGVCAWAGPCCFCGAAPGLPAPSPRAREQTAPSSSVARPQVPAIAACHPRRGTLTLLAPRYFSAGSASVYLRPTGGLNEAFDSLLGALHPAAPFP